MEEPPDPGGTVPPAAQYVTISNIQESSMDTDASCQSTTLKRKAPHRVCRHCNKRRRNDSKQPKAYNCNCTNNNSDQDTKVHNKSTSNSHSNSSDAYKPISRLLYNNSDTGPFIVHIQKVQLTPNTNCSLHPIEFGRFLKRNNFKNVVDGSLKRLGRNRLSISFSSFSDANTFVEHDSITANSYKAFIPSFTVTRIGIVRGIPAEWTAEEILANISLPQGCGEVLKIRRLKKKVTLNGQIVFNNIETVVMTFDGQVLPKRIYMCYNSLPVDLYIFPTIQCYNCCRYGHVKSQCRSTPRCYKCGQGHSGDTCSVEEELISCCLCKGLHIATSKKCPEFQRQKSIKESMARSCISYAEASKLHPAISKLYSDVLLSSPPSTSGPALQKQIPLNNRQTSYKKTVFLKPRSPTRDRQGYDQTAHNNLIKDINPINSTNGVAISDKNLTELSTQELIVMLIKLLTQNNILPPIDAPIIESVTGLKDNNHGLHNPMELSQCK